MTTIQERAAALKLLQDTVNNTVGADHPDYEPLQKALQTLARGIYTGITAVDIKAVLTNVLDIPADTLSEDDIKFAIDEINSEYPDCCPSDKAIADGLEALYTDEIAAARDAE